MSYQNNDLSPDRNLVDVFKELQQKRAEDGYNYQTGNSKNNHSSGITTYFTSNKHKKVYNPYSYGKKIKKQLKMNSVNPTKTFNYTKLSIGIIIITLIVSLALLFLSYSFTTYGLEENESQPAAEAVEFEPNQSAIDVTQIIASNLDTSSFKETLTEERVINFPIKYQTADNLPKGEEQVAQEGTNGTSKIVAVRTYEDNQLVEENIIESSVVKEPVEQIVNIGTSEFLAKYKVHLGDLMYVTTDVSLKKSPDDKSENVTDIPATLDVKLLELAGDWSKVSYDDKVGYLKNSVLTSATAAPEMVEKARVRRIMKDVKIDMPLNKKSGLALSDYKKMLSGNPEDTNKIFEENYEAFYEVEQKYNINGIFLASLAIHESAWGTSNIAKDKKNLFGYGSYDRDPYNSSYEFEDYKEGLELVAKVLVKNYLNPKDTVIYDNEKASATYYNGPTLEGVNKKYSTDSEWYKKVFNYMEKFYNKLQTGTSSSSSSSTGE